MEELIEYNVDVSRERGPAMDPNHMDLAKSSQAIMMNLPWREYQTKKEMLPKLQALPKF